MASTEHRGRMLSDGERGERIRELTYLAQCVKSLIQTTRHTIHNPQVIDRRENWLVERIAKLTAELGQLRDQRTNAHDRLDEYKARLSSIESELATLQHAEKIAAFKKLFAEVNAMRESGVRLPLTPEELAEIDARFEIENGGD